MEEEQTNLIVNYLPQSMQDEEFRSLFESIGPIKSSKIVRDKSTGYSYGFGFVDYQSPKDAATAISQLTGYRIEHKTLKVAYSRRNEEESKGTKLYLQKLPLHYTEEEVSNYLSSYGNIVQVRVVTDRATGQSKGIGFILFSKRSEAEAAITDLDNKVPPGGTQPLRIKFADDNAKKVKPPVSGVPVVRKKFFGKEDKDFCCFSILSDDWGHNEFLVPLSPIRGGLVICLFCF